MERTNPYFEEMTDALEFIHAPDESLTAIPLGDGTEESPFRIWFLEHFDWMRADNGQAPKKYKMMRDMNFLDNRFYLNLEHRKTWTEEEGWLPITNYHLYGEFNGNEKKLFNLFINRPSEDAVGLFKNMIDINVKDFSLINVDITGNNYVGSLAGTLLKQCSLKNIYMSGRVKGIDNIGGITGSKEGASRVDNIYVSNEVTGRNYVGGVIGRVGRYITGFKMRDITHVGKVIGEKYVGGIIGMNIAKMNMMRITSDSEVSGINKVGGIIGESVDSIEITRAKARTRISGNNSLGGIIGKAKYESILAHIEVSTDITGNDCLGGLIGKAYRNTKILIAEYNGSIAGKSNIGGMVGKLDGLPEIDFATSHGDIHGERNVGGIIGSLNVLGLANVFHSGNAGHIVGECNVFETKGFGVDEKFYPMENVKN